LRGRIGIVGCVLGAYVMALCAHESVFGRDRSYGVRSIDIDILIFSFE
jgi:7,8-dihydro-6-hydroxymethylpterin-pyrophosphokinase